MMCGGVWANTVDYDPFAARYPAYSSTFSCGACHTASPPALNPYGSAYKLAVEARGGRFTANVGPALADIETLDADGDGYTNISEINDNKNAGDAASHPTITVSLSFPFPQSPATGNVPTVINYSIQITNNGSITSSFNLAATVVSGENWATSAPASTQNIAPGQSQTFQVSVSIPNTATNTQQSVARITATSQVNPSISATPLQVTTVAHVPADVRYVSASTGSDIGECALVSSPCKTITYALSRSFFSETVSVAAGIYNIALGEVFPLLITSSQQLTSLDSPSGGPLNTIIDASGSNQRVIHILTTTSNSPSVKGFTITGGRHQPPADGSVAKGGGILVDSTRGAGAMIFRNLFLDNEARGYDSDGITYVNGGDAQGGALFIERFQSSLSIRANVFVGNSAIGGNGRNNSGSATAGGNGGKGQGGAIYAWSGMFFLNTIHENLAQGGAGGASNGAGGSGGEGSGGGAFLFDGANFTDAFGDNIVTGNIASGGSGGAGSPPGATGNGMGGPVTIVNDPNHAWQFFGNFSFGNSVTGGPGSVNGTQGSLDPQFHAPPLDLRIRRTSPAASASTTFTSATDFDGRARRSPASKGAFEPSLFAGDRIDLNNDHKSDLLWRNVATGQVFRMTMNGFAINSGALIYNEPNTAWRIVGDGDFNGDGFTDLMWRNSSTGQVYLQLLGAGGFPINGGFVYTEANPDWKIVDTPDLNGDGKADILWWNSSTGQVYALIMDGFAITAQGLVYTEPNTAWRIVATGDFAGNGKTNQLLWHNGTTGQVYQMTVSVAGSVFTQSLAFVGQQPNTAWKIVAAGDFNADSKFDILWRNEVTGEVSIMLMNGPAVASQAIVYQEPNSAWRIVATGDYNGDGKADLLWRNESTGQVWMTQLNGLAIASQGLVYTEPNTAWKLMGPAEYAQ